MSGIIGEGAFGCVHKPPLQCSDKKMSYNGKISKLLSQPNEMERLLPMRAQLFSKDTAKYIINAPDVCSPRAEDLPQIKKCEGFKNVKNINKMKLYIYDDAGISLDDLTSGKYPEFIVDISLFRELSVLFDVLTVFLKKEFAHYDIKAENIMYNASAPAGERVKLIDFGIASFFVSIDNKFNNRNVAEASYMFRPPELPFLTAEKFNLYRTNQAQVYEKYNTQHGFMIDHTFDNIEHKDRLNRDALNSSIFNGGIDLKNAFLSAIRSIDSYGLGIALKRCLNYGQNNIPAEIYSALNELFYEMYHPDPKLRIGIEMARNRYNLIVGLPAHAATPRKKQKSSSPPRRAPSPPRRAPSPPRRAPLPRRAPSPPRRAPSPPRRAPSPPRRVLTPPLPPPHIPTPRSVSPPRRTPTPRADLPRAGPFTTVIPPPAAPSSPAAASRCPPEKEWYEPTKKCYIKCKAGQVRNPVTHRCKKAESGGRRRSFRRRW